MLAWRKGFFSINSIIVTAISFIAISGIAFAGDNAIFSPGNLSAKAGPPLGNVIAHNQIQECSSCHAAPWSTETMGERCLDCHTNTREELQQPNSLHSLVRFSQPDLNCLACHTEHHGPEASLTEMPPGWNPHEMLGFSLDAHRLRLDGTPFECRDCHSAGYTPPYNQRDCANCHLSISPVAAEEHILTFWTDCLACHDGLDTYGAAFDHGLVPFPLTGLHILTPCGGCHVNARNLDNLRAAPQECSACHLADDPHEGRFGVKCGMCHTPNGWTKSAQFDHNLADFKLVGKHEAVACEACHVNHVYRGIPSDCVACHAQDDKHDGAFGPDCGACHTPEGWERAVDHSQFAFPLEGKHANLACESCHAGGVFKGTPMDCVSCHAQDDGHAGSLGSQCGTCHTPQGWSPAAPFDHNTTSFSLAAHTAKPDGSAYACRDCHVTGYAPPFNQTSCADCHFEVDLAFTQQHISDFRTNCLACHDGLDSHGAAFDHNAVAFQLTGSHAQASCSRCHFGARSLADLRAAPQECRVCHQKDDFHAGTFDVDCSTCHSTTAWKPASFDHNSADFKLTGKHAAVACGSCHADGRYTITPTACFACHSGDDQHNGGFGTDCAVCHTPDGWELAQVDHSTFAFPLEGQHALAACESCHAGGIFKGTPTVCSACHLQDDAHDGGLGDQCGVCHTPSGWKPANFDHETLAFSLKAHQTQADGSAFACQDCHTSGYAPPFNQLACATCHLAVDFMFTQAHILTFWTDCLACHDGLDSHGSNFDHGLVPFPLAGQHDGLACFRCHLGARTLDDLRSAPQNCSACHLDDDRHNGQFGADCGACHSPEGWELARVDHSKFDFQLLGRHGNVACESCHVNGVFDGTPTECVSCHLDDDAHAGGFGTQCGSCHTPDGWELAQVDHSQFAFPLEGKHTSVACESCHVNGVFDGTPTECVSCHLDDDAHGGSFGTQCESCHTPDGWELAQVDHSQFAFPLEGKHTTVACETCHVNGVFDGTPTDCVSCHLDDDAHAGSFGTQCESCHTPGGWELAQVDHSKFAFQLLGKHATVACESCHVNGVFDGTPTDCASCHLDDDAHAGALGTLCATCHTPNGWKPASFDHNQSAFPLTGKHTLVQCDQCHVNQVFKGTPRICSACHTLDDPHSGALGTACESCHTTSGWESSTFNHNNSIFPLTGAHISLPCAECHTDLKFKGTPTLCYACHADNDRHGGKYGTNCGVCHSTTAWKPATFDHNLSAFPLTGAHVSVACEQCHANGVFDGTPTACSACHADPAFHLGLFGTDCASCHTTTAWRPASFTGPHTFPTNHGDANACRDCHPSTLSSWTCYTCHDQSEVANKHREEGIDDFSDCLSCHPTGRED
ncbi:MAG: hypothetical protein AB1846_08965 [Chloroflexota bacterium]